MPLKRLEYLDLSNNYIKEPSELEPLKRLNRVELYIEDNPITEKQGWKSKIKYYNIKIIKEPKKLVPKFSE